MAETAVSLALGEVFQLLKEETDLLRGVHTSFSGIKDELESILVYLRDADRKAADEADTNEAIRTWVKHMREVSFRIEDVIDEYLWLTHGVNSPGCGALIKEISERYNFEISHEPGSSSSSNNTRQTENKRWNDPRLSFLFTEEASIVGFEGPREELTGWLLDGAAERTVISVVGMGGLGKTTLAKLVFDSKNVITTQFDCRACIRVSQSYTVRGLLMNMMEEFTRETDCPLLQMLHKMDDKSLIIQVRQYLQHKKYLIFFDDIWQEDFSDQVEFALPNNNKAWELFCKKAFRFEHDGQCPPELKSISKQIVRKCNQLPLAIVAVGGLFSTKAKTVNEWQMVSQNLNLELGRNAHLSSLTKILSLSYDDLPYYLKPCILYFGIYPEDYCINHKRLIQEWIAEGFIKKSDGRRTSEQVAEEYLSELVHRSLVLVSKVGFEGKVKTSHP
ncbi:NBS-containing resistance-like protein [Trifolium pratense]|uniref:NBS-containing resistance-like protein n=1 Tax=Trifolium pratense TaxID=57577 RepID=A0A2K3P6P4_TRIPR|nr:NBS-containing resistance-like protein [Trifolium pratense]